MYSSLLMGLFTFLVPPSVGSSISPEELRTMRLRSHSMYWNLFSVMTLLVMSATGGEAKILEQLRTDCGNGREAVWTLFEDDCNGGYYTLYVDCDGKHHWGRVRSDLGSTPFGISIHYPNDFPQQLSQADFSAWGADVYYVYHGITGLPVIICNPQDMAESSRISSGYYCSSLLY